MPVIDGKAFAVGDCNLRGGTALIEQQHEEADMTDAHNVLQPLTVERIDLSEEQSVVGWTVRLAVGEAELREAVDAVGTCPSHVREYLGIR